MSVLARAARLQDLDQCLALVADRFVYDKTALAALKALWLHVLTEDIGTTVVVFDEGSPYRVLAFALSICVAPGVFREIASGDCERFVSRRVVQRWTADCDVLLDEKAIASANADEGVDILVLSTGMVEMCDRRSTTQIYTVAADLFFAQHFGMSVRSFAIELFGSSRALAYGSGMQLCRRSRAAGGAAHALPSEQRTLIAWMTRAEAVRHPGNLWANRLFLGPYRPRLGLNAAKRRMLRLALEGECDSAIGDVLGISPATVKKRWLEIYEDFRPDGPRASEDVWNFDAATRERRRGAEMRRHVLQYVRLHPEELHPNCGAGSAASLPVLAGRRGFAASI